MHEEGCTAFLPAGQEWLCHWLYQWTATCVTSSRSFKSQYVTCVHPSVFPSLWWLWWKCLVLDMERVKNKIVLCVALNLGVLCYCSINLAHSGWYKVTSQKIYNLQFHWVTIHQGFHSVTFWDLLLQQLWKLGNGLRTAVIQSRGCCQFHLIPLSHVILLPNLIQFSH